MFRTFRQLVDPLVERYKLGGGIEAARVTGAWTVIARETLGPNFPVPEALCLKDHVLWLEMPAAVVAQEVQLAKIQLLDRFGALFGEQVKDIRFRTGTPARDPRDVGRAG